MGISDELARLAELHDAGAISDAEFTSAKTKLIEAIGTDSHPARRAWHQRSGVWVAIAVACWLIVGPVLWLTGVLFVRTSQPFLYVLFGSVATAAASLWVATLMARRRWTRIVLAGFAALFLVGGTFSMATYVEALEFEAFEGCEQLPVEFVESFDPDRIARHPPGTETVMVDPEACARTFDDPQSMSRNLIIELDGSTPMSVKSVRRLTWALWLGLFVAPPALVASFRRVLRSENWLTPAPGR